MILLTGRNKQRGFSLLELLVVIFIIGLMSGVAVLTLPGKDGEALLREERAELMNSLRSARSEAVFSGRSLGLLWGGNSGRYMSLTENGWQAVSIGPLSRKLELDSSVRAEIAIGGEPLSIPDENDGRRQMTPQIQFLSDGQVSPFEWRLRSIDGDTLVFDDSLRVKD